MSATLNATRPSLATNWNDRKLAKQADVYHSFLLEHVGNREKIAAIGGDQETQFEQAFAALAYTYIKDKAPRLLDFMVGFQLVERNDDNTKAIGIFGFKLDKSWLYGPVFFLNGDLKGHELLYLKEQDRFVPLKENWVNHVLSRKPHVLGRAVGGNAQALNVQQPDIRQLSIPPYNSKYSSAQTLPNAVVWPNLARSGWNPPSEGFRHVYAAMTAGDLSTSFDRALSKYAGFKSEDMLRRFVRESVGHCKLAMDICERYPSIGDSFNKFYGADFFKEALFDLRKQIKTSGGLSDDMSKTVAEYHFGGGAKHKKKKRSVLDQDRESTLKVSTHALGGGRYQAKFAAGPSVEIKVKDDVLTTENGEDLSDLTDQEAEAIARDGYLVKDHRAGEEVSKAYNTQVEMQLVNPDGSGMYDILQKPGTFVETIVIANPMSARGRKDFSTVVRLEPKDWLNAHRTTLFGKPNTSSRERYEKWYNGLSDKQSLEEGGVYLVVSENGEGTTPFEVEEKLSGEGRYKIRSLDYPDRDRPTYLPSTNPDGGFGSPVLMDSSFCCGPELLYLDDREGRTFRSSQNILQVPSEHKILTLKKPAKWDPDVPHSISDDSKSEDTSFEPGNLADLQLEILQKTSAAKLHVDGLEASVNGGPLRPKFAAMCSLIQHHGLRYSEANKLMKLAERANLRGEPFRFRILYGPAYPLQKQALSPQLMQMIGQGPSAPGFPEQESQFDSAYGGVPSQYPATSFQGVPEMSAGNTDQDVYNPMPEYMPDQQAMQQAQQAGQMGQKEVFDSTMISGMLKAVRQDSLVDRYMGDLLKALDRLGRILFMFYWHNDEFSDRYGKADMPELEDTLRNSFEVLGDLVLFLKEKDVEPLMRGENSEPDVEEASRN